MDRYFIIINVMWAQHDFQLNSFKHGGVGLFIF